MIMILNRNKNTLKKLSKDTSIVGYGTIFQGNLKCDNNIFVAGQVEGDIIVKTQQEGKLVQYEIKEGEMFLLPSKVPHSPVRSEGSIGLVIERKRTSDHKDGLMWFSDKANALLYEEYFQLTDVEKDFLPVFKRFYGNEKLRTCPKTGEIMEAEQKYIDE